MIGPEGVDPSFFHDVYKGQAPWDIGDPQPEVIRLLEMHAFTGPILDVGCGTGENAILLSMAGYEVTGIDLVPAAIDAARDAAVARGLDVDLHVGDALQLAELQPNGHYRTILDSGVFHVFSDADRIRYVHNLQRLIAPAGVVHVIVFSDADQGQGGPRRVTRQELLDAFQGWHMVAMEPCEYHLQERAAKAWRATFERPGTTVH